MFHILFSVCLLYQLSCFWDILTLGPKVFNKIWEYVQEFIDFFLMGVLTIYIFIDCLCRIKVVPLKMPQYFNQIFNAMCFFTLYTFSKDYLLSETLEEIVTYSIKTFVD